MLCLTPLQDAVVPGPGHFGQNLQLHAFELLFSRKKGQEIVKSVLSLPGQDRVIKTVVISHAWEAVST